MLLKSSRKFINTALLILFLGCSPSLDSVSRSYEKLFSYYNSRLKRDPANLNLRIEFAEICYRFKEYEKIKELLKGQDEFQSKMILARALTRLKEHTKALSVFEEIEKDLVSPEAFYLYGLVLEEKNLYPKAVKIYRKVNPPFRRLAKSRLKEIKTKIGGDIPEYIINLSREADNFLNELRDEGAVILSVEERTEITPKNTVVSDVHIIEKVLQERGKNLAEVEVGYDSTYERVELEFARTISPQGQIVYAGKESIRDVSKYLNFPLYSNARAFIISMPAVDVGTIIEYKVKIYSSKLIDEKNFTFTYRLREKYPVYKARFNLVVPENKGIRFKFFNEDFAKDVNLNPEFKKIKGSKIYAWKFKEILPIIPEENMPPLSLVNPAILITSFESWEEICRWWDALYKDKLKLNQEAKDFLQDLIKGINEDYEKAKKIYEYVAKNIRYVAVEYGESGHEPHYANEVFLNKYGDCKDQAIFLVSLLNEAGLKSFPVLIPTQRVYPIAEEFPSVNFNHAICAVKLGDTFIFMDPTSETTSFGDLPVSDQDRTVLVFLEEGYKILKTPQIKNSKIIYDMDIEIDDQENIFVKRKVAAEGVYASYQRWYFKYTHPLRIKENIEQKMTEISPFSNLIDYKIKNVDNFDAMPELEYEFRGEKFLNPAKNLRVIPSLNSINIGYSLVAKGERNFPVDFQDFFTKEAKIKIKLPSSLKVKYLPDNAAMDTDWFFFKLFYKYDLQNNTLIFLQKFTVKQRIIPREEYEKFKKSLKEVFYLLREEIILEKEPKS